MQLRGPSFAQWQREETPQGQKLIIKDEGRDWLVKNTNHGERTKVLARKPTLKQAAMQTPDKSNKNRLKPFVDGAGVTCN